MYQLYDRFLNKTVKSFNSLGAAGFYLSQLDQEYRKEGSVNMPRYTVNY